MVLDEHRRFTFTLVDAELYESCASMSAGFDGC